MFSLSFALTYYHLANCLFYLGLHRLHFRGSQMMLDLDHLQTSRLQSCYNDYEGHLYISGTKKPKIEAWGTEHLIGSYVDDTPQIFTRCILAEI